MVLRFMFYRIQIINCIFHTNYNFFQIKTVLLVCVYYTESICIVIVLSGLRMKTTVIIKYKVNNISKTLSYFFRSGIEK